jgi:hypothetical protein
MNRTSLAVPARTPLNQRLNPHCEHRYTKLPPGSASGSDALNRWSQERLGSRLPLLHTRTERDGATFSPTGGTRRNYLSAKRAAKAVRKRIAIANKLAKLAKHGRIAQLSFWRRND